MRTILLAALFALALAAPSHAALPPGISGAWFNPAQPGHGLTIEILDGGSALVFWHVFDPDGNPVHLYIEGNVVGRGIEGQAFLGHGMRFGSFDPDAHELEHWGTVSLAFASCNQATLAWTSEGPAGADYPDGSMALARLTQLAGLDCALPPAGSLPAGQYTGTVGADRPTTTLRVAVDTQQRLWAASGPTPHQWVIPPGRLVFFGSPVDDPADTPVLSLTAVNNAAMSVANMQPGASDGILLRFEHTASGLQASADLPDDVAHGGITISRDAAAVDPLQRPLRLGDLSGRRFGFTLLDQFFTRQGHVRFTGSGTVCIDTPEMTCHFIGTLSVGDPGLAMLDVRLIDRYLSTPGTEVVYTGKLWVEFGPDGVPLELVVAARGEGSASKTGLGLVAHPEETDR